MKSQLCSEGSLSETKRDAAALTRLSISPQIVKMFSAQPPLRIDSFEAEGSSAAKKRFLNRVGKCLLFSVLKIFSLLEAFLSIASRRPSYKDAAFIQRRWSLHSTTMEPPLSLKEDDILIEMEFSSLFCPHFPPLERLFRLLFHEFQLSRLFTFCQRFSSLILIVLSAIMCLIRFCW